MLDVSTQANLLALLAQSGESLNTVYNVAYGEETTLTQLFEFLREDLSAFDPEIRKVHAIHGPERRGDIPHSLADISKARRLLGYAPEIDVREGLRRTARWYFDNLR